MPDSDQNETDSGISTDSDNRLDLLMALTLITALLMVRGGQLELKALSRGKPPDI